MGWVLGHRDLTGSIAAAEVNTVIDCLAELSTTHQLPQKLLVLHQFRLSMLRDQQQIRTDRPQVAVLIHMDGQGTPRSSTKPGRRSFRRPARAPRWGGRTSACPEGHAEDVPDPLR